MADDVCICSGMLKNSDFFLSEIMPGFVLCSEVVLYVHILL